VKRFGRSDARLNVDPIAVEAKILVDRTKRHRSDVGQRKSRECHVLSVELNGGAQGSRYFLEKRRLSCCSWPFRAASRAARGSLCSVRLA
jgi:hypothetical protein